MSALPLTFALSIGALLYALPLWLHGYSLAWLGIILASIVSAMLLLGWLIGLLCTRKVATPRQLCVARYAVFWFIVTEVWFFAALFAVLFYGRWVSVPTLAGEYTYTAWTHYLLWPQFDGRWPLLVPPDPLRYTGVGHAVSAWGLPAINTAVLLSSAVSITYAHLALVRNARIQALSCLVVTMALGLIFLGLQYVEYQHLWQEGWRWSGGMYAAVFFILTGFHGLHVLLGVIALSVVTWHLGCSRPTARSRFAFAVASWYWHFVDVIWLALFVLVYRF